ncbi:hypothetical protein BDF22DRAFT_615822, partial [Syncephalis plumigaleata]
YRLRLSSAVYRFLVYLGLPICTDGIDIEAWKKRAIEKGRRAIAGLRRLGLHQKGFSWQTTIRLYKTFIRPTMEYGMALICPTDKTFKDLEKIQLKVLREAAKGRSNTSHGTLYRISNCVDLQHRAKELAAKWLARTELPTRRS